MKRITAGLVALQDNCLLLVCKRDVWIPPGGKPEKGESLVDCLIRECSEELPKCALSDISPFGYWDAVAPHKGDTIECWMFQGVIKGELMPSREITDARWVPNNELDHLSLSTSVEQVVKTLRFMGRLI